MANSRIVKVEYGVLEGTRPRAAGSNARLGAHGNAVKVPILRIETDDGLFGFGACRAAPDQAERLVGRQVAELVTPQNGVAEAWRVFDYPLWDLAGQQAGKPVYALTAAMVGATVAAPFSVPCYDTSLYFDDLHLADDRAATQLIVDEAQQGYARGQRAFKIKVGRGARHMPIEAGTRRDIAIIEALRAALGPDVPLMIDANNGYTLNIAKQVLDATAECKLLWLEEAFHEDDVLYRDLRGWLRERGLATLIADGEGHADPRLLDWARAGLVDVIQYDIFSYGFTSWLKLGQQLDAWNVRAAPHHYGGHYGNYAAGHLAGGIRRFTFVEWDEASTPGLDTSGYQIVNGRVALPNAPGFGIGLDTERFKHAVAHNGFVYSR